MRKAILLLIFFFLLALPKKALSVECGDTVTKDNSTAIANACRARIDQLANQKSSLASEIEYMDTQITLTKVEISKNTQEIENLKNEIENLSTRISELNNVTDKIAKTMKLKIESMYKRQQTKTLYTFMNATNLTEFMRSIQYLRRSQISDREFLLKLQNTKVTFEEQKDLRQEKETELNQLTARLQNYQVELASQQQAKEQLLEATKNDEKRYQQLLADAQRQIASFKAFVQNAGGGAVGADGLGTGYDGNYYSQRDSRWGYSLIGKSNENILNVGCLVTSVAMVLKQKGVSVTPSDIAANSSYFVGYTADMWKPTKDLPSGYTRNTISDTTDSINAQLDSGNPVIVGIRHGTFGTHFLVLKKRDGDDYIVFDPYYGPDKKFKEIYENDLQNLIFQADILN